jgi:predicted metal-dependent enzyme (double-stranded beta helix superfamily)
MSISRMRNFVVEMIRLVDREGNDEGAVLEPARESLAVLIATDDWLPDVFPAADPARCRQYILYILYGDPIERFSLVSFVWGPGQRTPVHDHRM